MTAFAYPGDRARNTFSIGLVIALSSWGLIFLTMVWGYIVFRLRQKMWLQEYITPATMVLVLVNTAVLWGSSLALGRGRQLASKGLIGLAAGLAIFFLAGQTWLWGMMLTHGLHWQKNMAGSFLFLLTGFHFLHILLGIPFLMHLAFNAGQEKGRWLSLGVKYFWDFLLVVWMVLLVLIFIIQ